MLQHKFLCALLLGILLTSSALAAPVIIAHRGASGYLPEHTLEAYALAHALGADYIEQDLVLTKDGHFICLHDIHLQSTTNVEEVFPDRVREDGKWYAIDFTLAEIKTLDVHERLGKRFPKDKSAFEVPTFAEAIELIQGLNQTRGKDIGIYPEMKGPAFHEREGQPVEEKILAVLAEYGYEGPDANVFVQCFETPPLLRIRKELKSDLPLVQLISGNKVQAPLLTQDGLKNVATYANGIGPDKNLLKKHKDLVQWAHDNDLVVHPYTIRRDAVGKPHKNTQSEIKKFFYQLNVDGMFFDFPDDPARVIRMHAQEAKKEKKSE